MEPFLPFHIPEISEEEIESVVATLRSGWLTTGEQVRRFEQEFAERINAKHAVAVNSCTAALHLALEAIGITEGDEVIVPHHDLCGDSRGRKVFQGQTSVGGLPVGYSQHRCRSD